MPAYLAKAHRKRALQVATQIKGECASTAWLDSERYIAASRKARADILEWTAREFLAEAAELRSEDNVAE